MEKVIVIGTIALFVIALVVMALAGTKEDVKHNKTKQK